MSIMPLGAGRKIVVIDDQIGRDGPFRSSFLDGAGRAAEDFLFLTGQDAAGRNCADATVQRVAGLWREADAPRVALVLLDVLFDDGDDPGGGTFGFRLLDALREACGPALPVVMLTRKGHTRETAGERSADGFLPKTQLRAETLHQQLARNGLVPAGDHGLQGGAVSFLLALREIRRVAERGVGELLLLGETGTGKSEMARYAHAVSRRRDKPFQKWVAQANNAETHYSELFGYWRGAFTGAGEHRAGVAEEAHEGTLFIDEIAELTPAGQTALFEYRDRHRKDGRRRVRRLGRPGAGAAGVPANYSRDEDRILVDTFLITATNKPIQDPAWRAENGFRQELYNRLGHRVEIPPLRARRADVVPLFRHFLEHAAGRPIDVDADVRDRLASHAWTDGNLAELAALADGVSTRIGPDFDRVRLHHLDGLLADSFRRAGRRSAVRDRRRGRPRPRRLRRLRGADAVGSRRAAAHGRRRDPHRAGRRGGAVGHPQARHGRGVPGHGRQAGAQGDPCRLVRAEHAEAVALGAPPRLRPRPRAHHGRRHPRGPLPVRRGPDRVGRCPVGHRDGPCSRVRPVASDATADRRQESCRSRCARLVRRLRTERTGRAAGPARRSRRAPIRGAACQS